MFFKKRTHTCGILRAQDIGKTVTLNGWVDTRRDLGGVVFIDLRDRYGKTQVVFNPQRNAKVHEAASALRSEYVIAVTGKVEKRPEGTENPSIPTGEIDVMVIGKADVSGDSFKVLADEIYPLETVRQKFTKSIILSFRVDEVQENTIAALRQVMERYKGNCRCYFNVMQSENGTPQHYVTTQFGVDVSDQFFAEVKKILGPNSVQISQNG